MTAELSARAEALLKTALTLPVADRAALLRALQADLHPPRSGLAEATALRRARFVEERACPHCLGQQVVRNGTYQGRQRYLCRAEGCGRSFNDFTATPFHGSWHREKWSGFLDLLLEGESLRAIAEKLQVSVSTAFYWRHKVLLTLDKAARAELAGVVESDETYLLESRKGQRGFTDRLPRRRGGVASRRGISREQVCIFVATDRHGKVVSTVAGYGRLTTSEIKELLAPHASRIAALCTDEEAQFKGAAERLNVPHYRLNPKRGKRVKYGIYHVQNVNGYHSRLKKWLARFNGVSTRWLENYLGWHRALDSMRCMDERGAREHLLVLVCSVSQRIRVRSLTPRSRAKE